MDKEQEKLIIDALTDFVVRVSKGCSINAEEVKVLPAVATLLLANNEALRF